VKERIRVAISRCRLGWPNDRHKVLSSLAMGAILSVGPTWSGQGRRGCRRIWRSAEAVLPRFPGNARKVDVDAVSVCSFNNGHREPPSRPGAGQYVHLEKPMARPSKMPRPIMRAPTSPRASYSLGFNRSSPRAQGRARDRQGWHAGRHLLRRSGGSSSLGYAWRKLRQEGDGWPPRSLVDIGV